MNRHYLRCLAATFLATISVAFAQQSNENKLALEYYQSGEFEKAAELYRNLYNQSGLRTHFDFLVKCFLELEEYPQATKLIKQEIKHSPEELELYVQLGGVYKKSDKPEKATEQYETAIKKIETSTHQAANLGQAFTEAQEYQYAIQTYKKGQKLFGTDYGFHTELATVYFYMRDYSQMVNEYLELLSENDQYLETVQTRLQNLLFNDIDNSLGNILKGRLIQTVQKKPNMLIYQEMLVWIFIQEKDFKTAFRHASALDKRFDENGSRIFELGNLAASNNDEAAIDCFTYILQKGQDCPFYISSRERLLKTKLDMLERSDLDSSAIAITQLIGEYETALGEIGKSNQSVSIMLDYAYALAFFAKKPEKAIQELLQAQQLPNIKSNEKTDIIILLGKCYLFWGDIWEANLIFAKIERKNSNNPAGHNAKFMRAQIAYYLGDFKFAEALLDILKASTSKLISNDAFELAQLINDNSALDTSTIALEMFAHADLLFYQRQADSALLLLDSIHQIFPHHSLEDEILYRKAQYWEKKGLYTKAATYYSEIINAYGYDVLADNALFKLGIMYEEKLNAPEKAQEQFKTLLTKHPSSIFVPEAREHYRKLRGDIIN